MVCSNSFFKSSKYSFSIIVISFSLIILISFHFLKKIKPVKPYALRDVLLLSWINACLHNDYSKHLGPAVYLFKDHLEIFSYGNPLSVQTKEDFLRGVSVPINPELTSVFMKIDKAEANGKGINTIVEKYGKEVFEFSETHFTIKIPYNKKVLETINSQEITQENIQEKILKIIKEDPTVTRKILAIRLKTTPDSIKYYLDKMKKQGVIKHEGSTKLGYWEIIK